MKHEEHMSVEEYKRLTVQTVQLKPQCKRSQLEIELAQQIRLAGLPEPEEEYRFSSDRRYRFDFAWPHIAMAVEVEGGIWTNGRHTRGTGYKDDCKKYNYAQSRGWMVLRYPGDMVESGEALEQITELIRIREQTPVNEKKEGEKE
jgi:very-short-patch-repair endonuclease